MATPEISYSGLDALLTPEESVLLLVDHQAFQFANLHSQRDWARQETFSAFGAILLEHGGSSGVAFAWKMQLLAGAGKAG